MSAQSPYRSSLQTTRGHALDRAAMIAGNVNPDSWLATDYLNPFNEYIMLAEMVCGGAMDPGVLTDWRPVDYEDHFAMSGFAGAEVVLTAFRALPTAALVRFEEAAGALDAAILAHQAGSRRTAAGIAEIREARDHLAALITGGHRDVDIPVGETQSAIDALFD